jgi:glucosamine--fructose-6-phosphate aminotransferase (isomerizing)
MSDNHLINEILEQPDVLRRIHKEYVLKDNKLLKEASQLLLDTSPIHMTGMVTSQYGALQAASILNCSKKLSIVYNASELLHYHLPSLLPGSSLIAISQSGESAEIINLLKTLDSRLPVIGVYNSEGSYLANHCDIGLPILAGPQLACGSKTNLATMAIMLLLAIVSVGEDLDKAGQKLLSVADSVESLFVDWREKLNPAADFLADAPYTVFLGRGPGLVSALFTSCMFREVSKSVTEAMSAAEFRHGLYEMIKPNHRVVVFAPSGATHDLCINLTRYLINLGIPVLLVSNQDPKLPVNESLYFLQTEHHSEYWAPLLDLVPLQLIDYLLAEREGLQPGVLNLATYITRIE